MSTIQSQILEKALKFANQFSRHGKSVENKANSPMSMLCCGNCKFAGHQGKAFTAAFVKVSIYSLFDSLESGESLCTSPNLLS